MQTWTIRAKTDERSHSLRKRTGNQPSAPEKGCGACSGGRSVGTGRRDWHDWARRRGPEDLAGAPPSVQPSARDSRGDVGPDVVSQSPLCFLIATALNNALNDDHAVLLMGAVFGISRVMCSYDFALISPRLHQMLVSNNAATRTPSFLAIVAIGMHSPKPVDYSKILARAAGFVNCDSAMAREVAAVVIRDHIAQAADLAEVLAAFVGSYKDEDVVNARVAMGAVVVAIRSHAEVDADVRKKLSQIYFHLHPEKRTRAWGYAGGVGGGRGRLRASRHGAARARPVTTTTHMHGL